MDAGLAESTRAPDSLSCRAPYTLASDVLLLEVPDGTARLLDLRGDFAALDAAGAGALRALLSGGREGAVGYLEAHCGMQPHAANAAADAFIDQLRDERYLVETSGGKSAGKSPAKERNRTRGKWIAAAATPLLSRLRTRQGSLPGLLPLIKLSLKMTDWETTVEVCGRIAHRCQARPLQARTADPTAQDLDKLVRQMASRSLLQAECKERALLFWVLARSAHLPAALVVAVRLYPFGGHCWCECDGKVMTDDETRCAMFQPIRRYQLDPAGKLHYENLCAQASQRR